MPRAQEVKLGRRILKPGLHMALMDVSSIANMFLTLSQAVLIHVNTLINPNLLFFWGGGDTPPPVFPPPS